MEGALLAGFAVSGWARAIVSFVELRALAAQLVGVELQLKALSLWFEAFQRRGHARAEPPPLSMAKTQPVPTRSMMGRSDGIITKRLTGFFPQRFKLPDE